MPKYLICYDIPNTKRRKKISDMHLGYGVRANLSVFEIDISAAKFAKLKNGIKEIINKKSDSVRIYSICDKCLYKSDVLCNEPKPFEKPQTIFF